MFGSDARSRRSVGALFVSCLLVCGGCDCRGKKAAPSVHSDAAPPKARETTPATIVVGNLQNRIRARAKRFESGTATALDLQNLTVEYLRRAKFLGVTSDYARAARVAERLVEVAPKHSNYLLQAKTRAALHQWAEAKESLRVAKEKGADVSATADLEAEIALAAGDVDRAMAIRSTEAQRRPTPINLAGLAMVQAHVGAVKEADENFERAAATYVDASPLPLVWIWLEQGRMWEHAGKHDRARKLYERALAQLPQYAPASAALAAELARSGDRERAVELLEAVIEKGADDPQYQVQLEELRGGGGQAKPAPTHSHDAEHGHSHPH